jgi:hypothetical protein
MNDELRTATAEIFHIAGLFRLFQFGSYYFSLFLIGAKWQSGKIRVQLE